MHPRVLIVGTIPYNENTSSRAFDAYFHNWEKNNLRQIFSNSKTPIKGHCGSLYQITDARMLKRHFNRKTETGRIYDFEECVDKWEDRNDLEVGSSLLTSLYNFGSKKTPLIYLIRKWLWKKRYWLTESLKKWIDEFNPQCVFLAFSDDFFINEIALYISIKYDIPIMCCIGDDYYFNNHFSFSPFYHMYRRKYKKLINAIMGRKCSAIYISDKIRDKYNSFFKINGDTVYLTSSIQRHDINLSKNSLFRISYCGNIRMGRNRSLVDIGNCLYEIDNRYIVDVYSSERDKKFIKPLLKAKCISYHGAIPYNKVVDVFNQTDISVIVEGFRKKDVDKSRYSLSTKAADSLASGSLILTYGSSDCGVVEYMKQIGASIVCSNKSQLKECIISLLHDRSLQKELLINSKKASCLNHNLINSNRISEELFSKLIYGK